MRKQRVVTTLAMLCSGLSAAAQDGGPVYQDYLFAEGQPAGAFGGPSGGPPVGALPGAPRLDPGWIDGVPQGGWCETNERYLAELAATGQDSSRALCPPAGPCDEPALRDAFIPDGGTEVLTVRLSIHVFCESNGSNCAASPAEVDAAVARLNQDYAPWGLQFEAVSEYIKNSTYRNLDAGEEGAMKRKYADSPTTMLNIYVVNTPGGNWGTFPWSAYAQSYYGGVVMDDVGFANASFVLTHEVGHCLGLWHVFHGVSEVDLCSDCYEWAGRSPEDGDLTGDRCSDTNPTPRNDGRCYDPAGTDTCSGNPWLDTPYLNYMSYSYNCNTEFTPQQAGRMQCWTTDVLSGWLVPAPPPNVPGTPALSSQAGGQVLVAWTDNSNNEDGFRVERARKSGKRWVESQIIADVGAGVTSLTDAPGSGTFRYRVLAYNENGDSAWSDWAQINN